MVGHFCNFQVSLPTNAPKPAAIADDRPLFATLIVQRAKVIIQNAKIKKRGCIFKALLYTASQNTYAIKSFKKV